jgi:SAM-dependent methyltransferase
MRCAECGSSYESRDGYLDFGEPSRGADEDELLEYYEHDHPGCDPRMFGWKVEELLKVIGDDEPRTILDAGCGTGAILQSVATRVGAEVTAIVATDATLTKAQAKQLAVMAQDGLARAIYPAHSVIDGDVVFSVATGKRKVSDPISELAELGAIAANTLSRAIARGVFEATALPFAGAQPSWRSRFG